MALPNKIMAGFTAALWMQSGATPTPIAAANLDVWTGDIADIVGTTANGTGTDGIALNVEVSRNTY